MDYLGIDIGGTTIKAGLIDESGRVQRTRTAPTSTSDLGALLLTLKDVIDGFQQSAKIEGLGIGVPGLVAPGGVVAISPNIPCLRNVSLEKELTAWFRIPVITENDANAGAYGEAICGAAKGLRHVAYLTLGTGLGCGLVLDGRLFRGTSGYAGELGHTTIEPEGRLCACGAHGCLETRVSGPGIVRTAMEYLSDHPESSLRRAPQPLTAKDVYEAATGGDPTARTIFEETGRYLGAACANLINLLDLQIIVIGGGVMASGDLLLDPAIAEVRRRAFAYPLGDCQIVQSILWPDAGMIGAAMLARDDARDK